MAVLMKLKIIGVMIALLVAANWAGMPVQTTSACDEWTGPGLDDEPYQSLFSIGAPLQGRDDINRAAARALLDAWTTAGQPSDFDATPYTKYGPDCEGGINQINNAAASNTNPANNNENGNDND